MGNTLVVMTEMEKDRCLGKDAAPGRLERYTCYLLKVSFVHHRSRSSRHAAS